MDHDITIDPRDQLFHLAHAVNDANFRVQVAFLKLSSLANLGDPVPDEAYAELFRAIGDLHVAAGAFSTGVIVFRAET